MTDERQILDPETITAETPEAHPAADGSPTVAAVAPDADAGGAAPRTGAGEGDEGGAASRADGGRAGVEADPAAEPSMVPRAAAPAEPVEDEPHPDEPARDEPDGEEPARDEPALHEPPRDEPPRDEPAREEPPRASAEAAGEDGAPEKATEPAVMAGGADPEPGAEPLAAAEGAVPEQAVEGVVTEQTAEPLATVERMVAEHAAEPLAAAEGAPADLAVEAVASAETGGTEPAAAPVAAAAAAGPEAEEAEEADGDDEGGEEVPEDPALAELRQAREAGNAVEGKVIGWNRGGFHVVVGPVTAFCPSSEMELGRPKSPASYLEKNLQFKVIKFQKRGRRVVLSRAAVLTDQRQEVVGRLQPGAVVRGRVTSLPDFGAFVDLGGVEGLVHVSEISRSRVQRPKDALELGQEVEVKVLKVEQGGGRISLSMKDLEPDPWQGVGQRFHRGDRFSGKVLRKTDFGLFVELEPEVEGLLHVSQLPPGKSAEDPSLAPGATIEGWIREVDARRQRLSLSLREVPTEDPWREIGKRFPEGEVVEGVVESVAPFGVFVSLSAGVTGLLPNSQTGLPRGTNAARAFNPGQSVRVQVLQVDARRKRISLGREGSHVEGSKSDLQAFRKEQREREEKAPTAMAAAFARLRGDENEP
jgi:small subunit ribosomal protein S1